MTILSDTRRDPFDGAISYRAMDPENFVVSEFPNLPGRYGFQVQDRVKPGSATVQDTSTGGPLFDQVQNDPNPGQVRIDNDTGFMFFNNADDGTPIQVDYQGGGSNNSLANIATLAANDVDAVHVNVANEINGIAEIDPSASAFVIVEDVGDSFNKKKAQVGNLGSTTTTITAGGTTTTASAADVLLASMTFVPGAGNYLLFFSSSFSHSQDKEDIFFSVYVNGVQIAGSERHLLQEKKDNFVSGSINGIKVSPSAGQNVEVRWRTTIATATAEQRNFTLLKVA